MQNDGNIYMVVDIDKCWGCKACQVACKQEHNLPAGNGHIDVVKIEQKDEKGILHCDYVPVMCQHCDFPDCIDVCPTGAISRNDEQLVCIDTGLCIGCGKCTKACTYGCIFVEMINGKHTAQKCDLCKERRQRGFKASCEQHCLGRVFTTCGEDMLHRMTMGRYSHRTGKIVYVSSKLVDLGRLDV